MGRKAESYCVGFVKGSAAACKSAAEKFTDGTMWVLSKAVLDTYTSPAYISTPVPFRIDLSKSNLEEAKELSGADQPAVCLIPPPDGRGRGPYQH